MTARHHHLGHFLEAYLKLTQCLLGVTVGPVLNASCFLAAALDQRLALLLGLLAGLQRVVVNPLGLVTAFLLQTQGFTANRLQILLASQRISRCPAWTAAVTLPAEPD